MKENRIKVVIKKPVKTVFDFTIDPKNTPRWIEVIQEEKTSDWPVQIGTVYKSYYKPKDKPGIWNEYLVTDFVTEKVFELAAKDGNYHVRYAYTPLSINETEVEYFEWVDTGELENPFSKETLSNLQAVLER